MVPRVAREFIEWLSDRHPAVAAIQEAHLRDHGELFDHVLFGDVTRYAADLARRALREPEAEEQLDRLLRDPDAALLADGKDDPVDNLVWVSFVENAQGQPGDAGEPLRERLHSFPSLARALSQYE